MYHLVVNVPFRDTYMLFCWISVSVRVCPSSCGCWCELSCSSQFCSSTRDTYMGLRRTLAPFTCPLTGHPALSLQTPGRRKVRSLSVKMLRANARPLKCSELMWVEHTFNQLTSYTGSVMYGLRCLSTGEESLNCKIAAGDSADVPGRQRCLQPDHRRAWYPILSVLYRVLYYLCCTDLVRCFCYCLPGSLSHCVSLAQ